jgi:adenylate cyclase
LSKMISEPEIKRRLAAILVADIAGYTRMMEASETDTLAELRHIWTGIFNPAVSVRRGRVVKTMGDGALVEFFSVVDAVECALAIQRAMKARSPVSENPAEFRIGINLGDVIIDGEDIFGEGVNVAARLETHAPKGGILVSEVVHAQVKGKVGVTFLDSGEVRLKNIDRPLRVWRWEGDGVAGGMRSVATTADVRSGKPSVCVLPFSSLSSDPEQRFFADGLAIDLESALGLIGGIDLRSSGASADFQLSGSVRVSADQIRVTARLMNTAAARQLWSGRFDGRTAEIFSLQEEITRQVAVALQVTLTSGDYARLWDGQTKSLAAWERCVIANGYHERWSEADNRRARELLLEALEIDPEYVAAKMLLGRTWWYDARYYAQGEDREHALAEAERLAREVLARRGDGAALMMLGGIAWLRDQHDEALALCRRAARLCPGDAWVLGFLGLVCVYSGDLNEAISVLERAARLSPQTFTWIDFHIAHARAWLGDDAGALASLQRYIARNPQDCWGYLMLAVVHGFAGRKEDAHLAVTEAVRQKPDIDAEQVRRSNRYKDPGRLERVIALLVEAGLPE